MQYIRKIIITMLGVFLLAAPLSASGGVDNETSFKEVKQQTKELMQSFKNYSVDKKDEALKNAKSAMNELDKNIEQLENKVDNKWDSMTKKARKDAKQDLRELRKARNELSENFGSLKESSKVAWERIKTGFTSAYEKLANSWEKAEQAFSSK